MAGIVPTPEQFRTMMAADGSGPIVMVNLLKYRQRAAYAPERAEAKETLSGRAAYQRYGAVAIRHVMEAGGRIVWGGPQNFVMVGDEAEDDWDEVLCVLYPSRQAFLAMTQNTDYLAAHYHREAGLERTALLCCGAGSAA